MAHYEDYDPGVHERGERRPELLSTPPVLIVVCNNTGVSKEVYKHLAGYEHTDPKHGRRVSQGHHAIFSNYLADSTPKHRPPTLLIDSDALENSGQVNEEFRRVFKEEIAQFRQEYRRLYADRFELDFSKIPTHTELASAFSGSTEQMTLQVYELLRDNEVVYYLTREVLRYHFSNVAGEPKIEFFGPVQRIVAQWYEQCLTLVHQTNPAFKRLVKYWDAQAVASHIFQAITVGQPSAERRIRPVPNYYNLRGSTRFVHGQTTRPVFATTKSHVNYVVADTETWEQICAKVLEDLPEVLSYQHHAAWENRLILGDSLSVEGVPPARRCRLAGGAGLRLRRCHRKP